MQVSREYALEELSSARKTLSGWIKDLKDPQALHEDGSTSSHYPDGVPEGLSVDSIKGIPVDQLRAEMLALSGKLEALAMGISKLSE